LYLWCWMANSWHLKWHARLGCPDQHLLTALTTCYSTCQRGRVHVYLGVLWCFRDASMKQKWFRDKSLFVKKNYVTFTTISSRETKLDASFLTNQNSSQIRHEIFLWRIWDLQWRISFVTDASISTSVSTTWHAYCNCYLSWPYLYQPLLERTFQASWCAAAYVFFLSPLVGWTDWVLEPDHGKLFCCFLSMPVLRSGCSGSIWLNIGITPPTILP